MQSQNIPVICLAHSHPAYLRRSHVKGYQDAKGRVQRGEYSPQEHFKLSRQAMKKFNKDEAKYFAFHQKILISFFRGIKTLAPFITRNRKISRFLFPD
jgi:hypothetical protein